MFFPSIKQVKSLHPWSLRDIEVEPKWQWAPGLLETSKVLQEMEGYNVVSCNACLFYNSPIGTLRKNKNRTWGVDGFVIGSRSLIVSWFNFHRFMRFTLRTYIGVIYGVIINLLSTMDIPVDIQTLRIQSPSQMVIGVYNHLLRKVFRFHYHSQKVIGSLGKYTS